MLRLRHVLLLQALLLRLQHLHLSEQLCVRRCRSGGGRSGDVLACSLCCSGSGARIGGHSEAHKQRADAHSRCTCSKERHRKHGAAFAVRILARTRLASTRKRRRS